MNIVKRDNGKGHRIKRHRIEKPRGKKGNVYEFLTGWHADGTARVCVISEKDLTARLTTIEGPGQFLDDGTNLWWIQTHAEGAK